MLSKKFIGCWQPQTNGPKIPTPPPAEARSLSFADLTHNSAKSPAPLERSRSQCEWVDKAASCDFWLPSDLSAPGGPLFQVPDLPDVSLEPWFLPIRLMTMLPIWWSCSLIWKWLLTRRASRRHLPPPCLLLNSRIAPCIIYYFSIVHRLLFMNYLKLV